MSIESEDVTGQEVSLQDIEDAIDAITSLMAKPQLLVTLPPVLTVNSGNIRRCLLELQAIRLKGGP